MASKIQQIVPTFKKLESEIGFCAARFRIYKEQFESEGWEWGEFKRHLAAALILAELGL